MHRRVDLSAGTVNQRPRPGNSRRRERVGVNSKPYYGGKPTATPTRLSSREKVRKGMAPKGTGRQIIKSGNASGHSPKGTEYRDYLISKSEMKNGTTRGLCCEPRCKNRRRKDRLRCFTHDTRRNRANHPMRHAYRNLKAHAKSRGIPFSLTFIVFRRFALRTDYLNRTGQKGSCLTVDRRNNLKGYTPQNIQPLTRAENSMKQARRDAIRMTAGFARKNKS